MNQRLAMRVKNATSDSPRMIDAGKIALRGSSLKMRSMAVFDVQSMRFIASWKPARTTVPSAYAGR